MELSFLFLFLSMQRKNEKHQIYYTVNIETEAFSVVTRDSALNRGSCESRKSRATKSHKPESFWCSTCLWTQSGSTLPSEFSLGCNWSSILRKKNRKQRWRTNKQGTELCLWDFICSTYIKYTYIFLIPWIFICVHKYFKTELWGWGSKEGLHLFQSKVKKKKKDLVIQSTWSYLRMVAADTGYKLLS